MARNAGREVTDRDRGWQEMLRRAQVYGRDQSTVTVGVQGAQAEKTHGDGAEGISNLRLAGVHEFGAIIKTANGEIRIPERSFLRSTFDKNQAIYKKALARLSDMVLRGKLTVEQALGLFGEKATNDVKKTIEDGIDPQNAASTVARKGSSLPLVDTAELKNKAITYEVHAVGAKR